MSPKSDLVLRQTPELTTLCRGFLDRTNVANAAVFGLAEELNLKGTEYNTGKSFPKWTPFAKKHLPRSSATLYPRSSSDRTLSLTIFFVPYILFEIPSNVILKRLRPHVWLSICMFGFSLVTICQGLVQNYGGLLTTRFFLGVFESGMFPGSFYLIGMW